MTLPGWWVEIHRSATIAVTSQIVVMAESGALSSSFDLAINLEITASAKPVEAGAASIDVPVSLGMVGSGHHSRTAIVAVPVDVESIAGEHYSRTIAIAVAPAVAASASEAHYAAAVDIAVPVSVGAVGSERLSGSFALSVTPAIGATGAEVEPVILVPGENLFPDESLYPMGV